jgi:hypothetical protein
MARRRKAARRKTGHRKRAHRKTGLRKTDHRKTAERKSSGWEKAELKSADLKSAELKSVGKAGADQLTGERSSAGHQPVLEREPAGGLAVSPRTRANRTTARRRRASTRPTPAPQGRATNQDPPQRHPMQRHPMQWRAPAPPAVAMLQPEGGSGSRPSRCSPGWQQLQRRRLWMEEPRPWTPGAGKGLQEILRACQCKPMHNPHKRLTPRGFRAPA